MLQKVNVFAVDDTPSTLVALEAVLSDDCNLVLADSGSEAISILEKRRDIDAVLIDLQMPHMDGFEATAHIRQMPGYEDLPVIFITAILKEDLFVKKGYAVGGVDYFSKLFDPEILKMKIGIYASFRQKRRFLKRT